MKKVIGERAEAWIGDETLAAGGIVLVIRNPADGRLEGFWSLSIFGELRIGDEAVKCAGADEIDFARRRPVALVVGSEESVVEASGEAVGGAEAGGNRRGVQAVVC